MTTTDTKRTNAFDTPEAKDWFEQLIHSIKADQLQLETGVADSDKSSFYHNVISGNYEGMFMQSRNGANQFFVDKIVRSFMKELSEKKIVPNKLAFALTPATILAWAEINDDDEATEDGILLAEAKVNSMAKEFDFCLDTMLLEKSDRLQVPSHYISVIS
jgi:hypothetical protein